MICTKNLDGMDRDNRSNLAGQERIGGTVPERPRLFKDRKRRPNPPSIDGRPLGGENVINNRPEVPSPRPFSRVCVRPIRAGGCDPRKAIDCSSRQTADESIDGPD